MFIILPTRAARMTGRRAVLSAILIVFAIGFGIWSQFQPRTIGKGLWNINPGRAMLYRFDANADVTHINAEFTPLGASIADDYIVFIIDEAAHERVTSFHEDPSTLKNVACTHGTGPLALRQVSLAAGRYYICAANHGNSPVALNYSFTQERNAH